MSLFREQVGLHRISLHIQDREKYIFPKIKLLDEGSTRTGLYKWKLGIILLKMDMRKKNGAAGGLESLIRGD